MERSAERSIDAVMDALQTIILSAFDARELSVVAKCANLYDGVYAAKRALDLSAARLAEVARAVDLALVEINAFQVSLDHVGTTEAQEKSCS